MQTFDVYFLGETLPNADPEEVRRGVADLFNISADGIDRMFSGIAVRVKQGVDVDKANRYRAAFRDVGAMIQIVPTGAPAPTRKGVAAPTDPGRPTGARPAPAAPPTPAAPVQPKTPEPPAAGAFSLAEPGAIIDPTPPPPPAQIDTGSLEALPPNSGSLEDCRIEKPAREIPDISHMHLVDD